MRMKSLIGWGVLVLSLAGWTAQGARVGLVLSADAKASYRPYDAVNDRRYPLKMLSSLKEGDTVYVAPSGKMTLSWLNSGTRYVLTGPVEVKLGRGELKLGPGIAQVKSSPSREGVIAGKDLDLSKFGGATSRYAGFPVFVDQPDPELHLDLVGEHFESPNLQIRIRQAEVQGPWTQVQGTLVHGANRLDRLRLPGFKFEEGQTYLIYAGDKPDPGENDAQFQVVRIPADQLKGLVELEASAKTLEDRLEVVAAYRKKRLFTRAEKILLGLQKQYPKQANWEKVWDEFNEDRQSGVR